MPRGNNINETFDSFEDMERERARRRRSKEKTPRHPSERDVLRPRPTAAERKRPRRRDWMEYLEDEELVEEFDGLAETHPRNTKRRVAAWQLEDE